MIQSAAQPYTNDAAELALAVVLLVGAGLLGAAVASRALAPLLFEVRPSDPSTFVGVIALLAAVSVVVA